MPGRRHIGRQMTKPMHYSQETLLDLTIIDGLRELDDDGSDTFFKEIIAVYTEQFSPMTEKLVSAIKDNNADDLARAAHTLKGASLNIGAKELATICRTLEFKGKDRQLANLDELLDTLQTVYHLTLAEIHKL